MFGGGGGTVYGGQQWFQSQVEAIVQALMDAWAREQATGYVTPAEEPPTEAAAWNAIYSARPDLQEQHQSKYSDLSVTQYMEHWKGETGELGAGREWTDPVGGKTYRNTKELSAIEFAVSRGYRLGGRATRGKAQGWSVR